MQSVFGSRSYGLFNDKDFEYDEDEDFLASGAFAEVFKARLKKDRAGKVLNPPITVAAKVLTRPPNPRLSPTDKDLMCKEAVILTHLKPHQNVVGMWGFSPNPKHFVLLLEYIEGGSLEEWLFPGLDSLANRKPIDISLWKHRIDIACQVAKGLSYLHANKPSIAHMDMKCSNILMKCEDINLICKIADFGLSKMKAVSTRSRQTQFQASHLDTTPGGTQRPLPAEATEESRPFELPAGTAQYMAPEQLNCKAKMNSEFHRSLIDVYSFGLILWEIRERAVIFQGLPLQMIVVHKNDEFLPFNEEECPGCPDEYQSLIRDCYNKDPEKRPTSSDVLQRLEMMKPHAGKDFRKAFRGLPGSARAPEATTATATTVQTSGVVLESWTSSLAEASLSTFSEDVIRQHVEQLKANIDDTEAFATAAKLIHQIASGVLRDPKEDKFRRVNTESKSFGPVVWRYVKARALFYHVGFVLKEDKIIYLSFGANLEGLRILCSIFEDLLATTLHEKTIAKRERKEEDLAETAEETVVDLLRNLLDKIIHVQNQLKRAEADTAQRTSALENQIKDFRKELQRTNESSQAIEKLMVLLNKVLSLRDETGQNLRATADAERSASAPADPPLSFQHMVGAEENGRDFSLAIEQSEMQSLASAVRPPPPPKPPPKPPPLPQPAQNPDIRAALNEAKDELKQVVEESKEIRFGLGQILSVFAEKEWALKEHALSLAEQISSVLEKLEINDSERRQDATWCREKIQSILDRLDERDSKRRCETRKDIEDIEKRSRLEYGERQQWK